MKCKYCGEEFTPNTRGRKREYCGKEECVRKSKNEAQRKWYSSKMNVLDGTKVRIVEQKEKKVVFSSADRAIIDAQSGGFSKVIELARKLGAVRYEILEELHKCNKEQSVYDKQDQVFLHSLEEFMKQDKVYEDDVVKLVVEHMGKRRERRIIKDKQTMLFRLQQGIVENPDEFVFKYIKAGQKRIYTPDKKEATNDNKQRD